MSFLKHIHIVLTISDREDGLLLVLLDQLNHFRLFLWRKPVADHRIASFKNFVDEVELKTLVLGFHHLI